MSPSIPTLINLMGEPSAIVKLWHAWIARASRNTWTVPHARRRMESSQKTTITVYTAPRFTEWQTRLISHHMRNNHWITPRMLLTSGSIPQLYQNPLASFNQEKYFFLDLGIHSRSARLAAIHWIRDLLEIAAVRQHSVLFVPLVFLWNRSPHRKTYPPWYGFLLHNRSKLISTGAPLKIEPGVTLNPPEPELVRRIQIRDWNQESRVIAGDRKVSMRKLVEIIQEEPMLHHQLETIAIKGKDTLPTLLTRVSAYVREIADDYTNLAPHIWDKIVSRIFSNNFTSIEFGHEGLDKLRVLLRKHKKVLLVPSHRSHMDYMLISYSIFKQGLACPRVAAGINLTFWPMGYFFRKTGAFFIRRTFKGLDIYPHVFRAYLWHIMQKFQPVEFFIEGGRSRTGALLPAKLGMLNMIIEAINSGLFDDVHIVPLAVNYDRIPEEQSYINELSGKPKQKERLTSLLKSVHLLKCQFGQVSVATGNPLSLRSLIKNELSNSEQKDFLGGTIMNQIRLTMPVTPTSMLVIAAMGIAPEESIKQKELIKTAKAIFCLIREIQPDVPIAFDFRNEEDKENFWLEAIHRMFSFGNFIPGAQTASWKINPDRRYQVDYLRNSNFGLILSSCLVSWEQIITEPQTLSITDIAQIMCPEYHPIPLKTVYDEIDNYRELISSWSPERVTCLAGNIRPFVELCERLNVAIGKSEKPIVKFLARDWNDLFKTTVKSMQTRNIETTSTAVQSSFFKGFKYLINKR
ncbi:1-acyl-sn-glycerol-3-phosphate acyltransferase [bacterium]|nr:1-acyl-sn-glycerol-3-phosphate acyltransferase [bacterium]